MPHPAWLQGLAPNWGGEVMKRQAQAGAQTENWHQVMGSLLEKPQHPEAQNVYYTELNKKGGVIAYN